MTGEARIGAGFKYIYYGVANSSGYLQGNAASPASNGTIEGLLRLRGARTFPVQIPDRDRVPASGDDETLATFSFASEQLPQGVLAMAVRDLDFEALTQGTLAETLGDLQLGALAPSGQANLTMMLLLMREAKKFEGATKGPAGWEILMIPACEITALGAEWEQRTFSPYNYSISISKAARSIYGATYTEALRGTSELALEPVFSDNPIHIMGGFGDNAQTTFALTYAPKAADGNKVLVHLNGAKLSYGAGAGKYTVSGQSLIFGTAPGSGVHIGVMYEVDASVIS